MGTLAPPGPDNLAKSGHTSEKTTEFSQNRKQPATLSTARLPNVRRIYPSLETRGPDRLPEPARGRIPTIGVSTTGAPEPTAAERPTRRSNTAHEDI